MRTRQLTSILPASLALIGALVLLFWTSWAPSDQFSSRQPGEDGTPETSVDSDTRELIAGDPVFGPGNVVSMSCQWPSFRGPRRDAICVAGVPLGRQWPPGGPPVLWEIEVEEGYASPAILDGRVFLLDYDRQAMADTIRCLSLGDGHEIWRNSYPVQITPNQDRFYILSPEENLPFVEEGDDFFLYLFLFP